METWLESPLTAAAPPPPPNQVMMMVGVNPVSDSLGRVNKLEVIPLEELGRPRVDVVVNCSGVFRDLFVNQMLLLDRWARGRGTQARADGSLACPRSAATRAPLTPVLRHPSHPSPRAGPSSWLLSRTSRRR